MYLVSRFDWKSCSIFMFWFNVILMWWYHVILLHIIGVICRWFRSELDTNRTKSALCFGASVSLTMTYQSLFTLFIIRTQTVLCIACQLHSCRWLCFSFNIMLISMLEKVKTLAATNNKSNCVDWLWDPIDFNIQNPGDFITFTMTYVRSFAHMR